MIPGCDGDLGLDWLGNSSRRAAAVAAAVVAPGLGWNAWVGMPKSRFSVFFIKVDVLVVIKAYFLVENKIPLK